jgi:hypothetical protein
LYSQYPPFCPFGYPGTRSLIWFYLLLDPLQMTAHQILALAPLALENFFLAISGVVTIAKRGIKIQK